VLRLGRYRPWNQRKMQQRLCGAMYHDGWLLVARLRGDQVPQDEKNNQCHQEYSGFSQRFSLSVVQVEPKRADLAASRDRR